MPSSFLEVANEGLGETLQCLGRTTAFAGQPPTGCGQHVHGKSVDDPGHQADVTTKVRSCEINQALNPEAGGSSQFDART